LLSCENCKTDLSHVASKEDKTRQEVSIKVKKTFIDHVTGQGCDQPMMCDNQAALSNP